GQLAFLFFLLFLLFFQLFLLGELFLTLLFLALFLLLQRDIDFRRRRSDRLWFRFRRFLHDRFRFGFGLRFRFRRRWQRCCFARLHVPDFGFDGLRCFALPVDADPEEQQQRKVDGGSQRDGTPAAGFFRYGVRLVAV